jgi:hypothetical protein
LLLKHVVRFPDAPSIFSPYRGESPSLATLASLCSGKSLAIRCCWSMMGPYIVVVVVVYETVDLVHRIVNSKKIWFLVKA